GSARRDRHRRCARARPGAQGVSAPDDDEPDRESGYDDGYGDEPGSSDDSSDGPTGSSTSARAHFPTLQLDLPAPRTAARSFLRTCVAVATLTAGAAFVALDRGWRSAAELAGLTGLI